MLSSCDGQRAVGFILNRHGEIIVAIGGGIHLVYSSNRWSVFPESGVLNTLRRFYKRVLINHANYDRIFGDGAYDNWMGVVPTYLLMLCLTLRQRRRGELIAVWVTDDPKLTDLISDRRSDDPVEHFYHTCLAGKVVTSLPVSLVCNALSIDGATFIGLLGTLDSFGRIVHVGELESKSEGARTRAAEYLSKY